jgi:SAM-dependent methyltransferase
MTRPGTPARSTFQGLVLVVRYNWPYYVAGGAMTLASLAVIRWVNLPRSLSLLIQMGAAAAAFWMVSSLLVTFYVYDVSHLYRWEWLADALGSRPRRWATFHAGLDESSQAIRALYPESDGDVFDVYDPRKMTERSIERARTHSAGLAARTADPSALPLANSQIDAAFLIFAAHEIRDPADRVRFFMELRRSLVPGGRIVLVEHLRDAWNFGAYGPGSRHFFSRSEWTRVARESGFSVQAEQTVTPFVRCFTLEKIAAK